MKLGDSLGRSRRRRRKAGADTPPPPGESERDAAYSTGPGTSDSAARGAVPPDPEQPAGRGVVTPVSSAGRGRRLRRLLVAVAGFVFAGWFVGYLLATRIFFPAPPPPGDLFEVPDLRGLGLASAGERLAGAGLDLGTIDSLKHPSVAAGRILGQSPLPGQLGQSESPVRVTISLGPETRSVPDVRRLDEARARTVLETSGFVVTVDTTEAEEPRGRVIDVFPPPDSVVALPAAIKLLVSTGPPVVPMPLVLGMEQAEAESLLDSLGLVVSGVEEVFRFGRDQGIVVEQEPAADTELQRGSSVRLAVGRRGRGGNNDPWNP
jgi:beta-lactam-binding protein with PASTA domain